MKGEGGVCWGWVGVVVRVGSEVLLLSGVAFDIVGSGAKVTDFCEWSLFVVWWLARLSIGSRCDFLVIVSIVAFGIKSLGRVREVGWFRRLVLHLQKFVGYCSQKKKHNFNLRWIRSFVAKVKFK